MNKYIVGAVLSIGMVISPAFTQAAGLTDAQVQAILSLLSSFGADQSVINNVQASLTGGTPVTTSQAFCHNFSRDITVGSSGDDVAALNQALSSSGIDTTGNTAHFSESNAGDVVSFQAKYGIRQTGYVGPLTRKRLNVLYGCRNGQSSTTSTTQTTATTPTPTSTTETAYQCPNGTVVFGGASVCPVTETSITTISEQVKCVFNGATTEQKCWGDASTFWATGQREPVHYACSGVGTCVMTPKGPKGTPVTWGSSCGGSSTTNIDGNNEYANFSCTATVNPTPAPTTETAYQCPNGGPIVFGSVSACPVTSTPPTTTQTSAPTVTVSANTTGAYAGEPVTVTWSSTNATSCTLLGNSVQTGGSSRFFPLSTSTYTVNCSGSNGTASNNITVSVKPAPAQYSYRFQNTSEFVSNMIVGLTPINLVYDINGDGVINIADSVGYLNYFSMTVPNPATIIITNTDKAYIIGRMIVGLIPIDMRYDLNGDGVVNTLDQVAYLHLVN